MDAWAAQADSSTVSRGRGASSNEHAACANDAVSCAVIQCVRVRRICAALRGGSCTALRGVSAAVDG